MQHSHAVCTCYKCILVNIKYKELESNQNKEKQAV